MDHKPVSRNLDSPRVQYVIKLLAVAPVGMTVKEVANHMGVTSTTARHLLAAARAGGLIASTRGVVTTQWCSPDLLQDVVRAVLAQRAAIYRAALARRNAQRAAVRNVYASRRDAGLVGTDGRLIDPPDEPFVHRWVQAWAPLKRAPGPTSVFHYGRTL